MNTSRVSITCMGWGSDYPGSPVESEGSRISLLQTIQNNHNGCRPSQTSHRATQKRKNFTRDDNKVILARRQFACSNILSGQMSQLL